MQVNAWWQRGIVYEIYPRSFQDANADGVGDLAGITGRLDYLVELGVDALWIAPIYPSPMADFGYDVSDYCNIDPLFGTLSDFDRLLAAAHARGLKVILDFVPNHTSDQHPWFLESRSRRNSPEGVNPKRDWYLWHDAAADGGPPNNWLSNFGGPGWEWDAITEQYYCHSFLKQQPDVNWRNPELRKAMLDVLRYWLDRGVDGFRVDVMWLLIKDDQLRDNPVNPGYRGNLPSAHRLLPVYNANRGEVHKIVGEMRAVLDSYSDRVLIGEIYLPVEQLVTYYGKDLKGAELPFNFQLIQCAWTAAAIAKVIEDYEAALPEGAWPNWVLGNHDQPRMASRVGVLQARVAAMLLLTLRGTPTMYYGEELGMKNVPITPEEVQDPAEKNEPGVGQGRDPERSPMQWDDSAFAGFSEVKTWLPVNQDYVTVNVANQLRDQKSALNLYRMLIQLRRQNEALVAGSLVNVASTDNILRYERRSERQIFLVVLNFGNEEQEVPAGRGEIALSTHMDRPSEQVDGSARLRAYEGIIVRINYAV